MSNFHYVVSLLVADRVKSSLTEPCLKHVISVENNLPYDGQQRLQPQRLSEIIDEYTSYTNVSGTRASFVGQTPRRRGVIRFVNTPKLLLRGVIFIVMAVNLHHKITPQQ